ncbi:conserved hypothetical protein [Coccidioides posadasii str. Silveira]|uniref:Fungal-type protein kinase domain-containing protein n=1 Tax=Coccidioides posadasii (strain RMSCC 757 / Silveira) TaxID=443226 RepID=E9CYW7_COCPS|nr:conserved hypothetical protein [Coccidioides posadasii str. Silveira]
MARGGPPAHKPERCSGDCEGHWASHHHQHCRSMPQPAVQQPSTLSNQEHQCGLIVCAITITITILFDKNDKVYDNHILCCLVISPAGRPVDILENNIIITNPTKVGGMSGVLIDLDLAKECARHGWMKLKKLQLESHEGQTPPNDSMLKEWYTGIYKKIARIKRSDMGVDGFAIFCLNFLCGLNASNHSAMLFGLYDFLMGRNGLLLAPRRIQRGYTILLSRRMRTR